MTREEFDAARSEGKPIVDLIGSGVPRATAYKWESKRAAAAPTPTTTAELDDEKAPKVVRIVTSGKPDSKEKSKVESRESITEKTAGKLMEGIFLILAVQQQEEEWALTDTEKRELSGPLSDSLAMLPSPLAKAINEYAAPGVLAATLYTIVDQKMKRIERKRRGNVIPMRQQQAQQPQRAQQSQQSQPGSAAVAQPPPPSQTMAAAAAMAASSVAGVAAASRDVELVERPTSEEAYFAGG